VIFTVRFGATRARDPAMGLAGNQHDKARAAQLSPQELTSVDSVLLITAFDEPRYAVKFSCKSTHKFADAAPAAA
jgi:hypothetical protein